MLIFADFIWRCFNIVFWGFYLIPHERVDFDEFRELLLAQIGLSRSQNMPLLSSKKFKMFKISSKMRFLEPLKIVLFQSKNVRSSWFWPISNSFRSKNQLPTLAHTNYRVFENQISSKLLTKREILVRPGVPLSNFFENFQFFEE